ncbi:Succinate-semialdehyde dehydrogenase mitochondrial [Bienertia sinuspersici]
MVRIRQWLKWWRLGGFEPCASRTTVDRGRCQAPTQGGLSIGPDMKVVVGWLAGVGVKGGGVDAGEGWARGRAGSGGGKGVAWLWNRVGKGYPPDSTAKPPPSPATASLPIGTLPRRRPHPLSRRPQPANHHLHVSTEAEHVAARLRSSGMIRSQGLIAGKWTEAYDGKVIEVVKHIELQMVSIRERSKVAVVVAVVLRGDCGWWWCCGCGGGVAGRLWLVVVKGGCACGFGVVSGGQRCSVLLSTSSMAASVRAGVRHAEAQVTNPATGDVVANVSCMGARETNDAISAAYETFSSRLSGNYGVLYCNGIECIETFFHGAKLQQLKGANAYGDEASACLSIIFNQLNASDDLQYGSVPSSSGVFVAYFAFKKRGDSFGDQRMGMGVLLWVQWAMYDLLIAHKEELGQLITLEQGKPLKEAIGEVAYGASFIEFFSEEAKRVYGEIIPAPLSDRRLFVLKQKQIVLLKKRKKKEASQVSLLYVIIGGWMYKQPFEGLISSTSFHTSDLFEYDVGKRILQGTGLLFGLGLALPVGVVGVITPWNFPVAMITRKVGPALASGCTVVIKPSELTPLTALAAAELSIQAGIPPPKSQWAHQQEQTRLQEQQWRQEYHHRKSPHSCHPYQATTDSPLRSKSPSDFDQETILPSVMVELNAGMKISRIFAETLEGFRRYLGGSAVEGRHWKEGVVNVVMGNSTEIGDSLLASTQVRKITFTGSTAVGKKLMAGSANTVKRVSLELGGNAPCIIFDDADLDVAVKGSMGGWVGDLRQKPSSEVSAECSGWRCWSAVGCDYTIGIYEKFASAFSNAVQKLQVGDGFVDGVVQLVILGAQYQSYFQLIRNSTCKITMLEYLKVFSVKILMAGPLINEAAVQKVETFVEDAVSKPSKSAPEEFKPKAIGSALRVQSSYWGRQRDGGGARSAKKRLQHALIGADTTRSPAGAKVLLGGRRHRLGMTFYEPTVMTDIKSDMRLSRYECAIGILREWKRGTVGVACNEWPDDYGESSGGGLVDVKGINDGGLCLQIIMFDPPVKACFDNKQKEEIFGPIAPLHPFKTEADAIHLANDTNAGLAAYIFTKNVQRSWRVSEALEYGIVGVNEGLVSTEVAPFGGFKQSGIGREGSKYGMDEYVEVSYKTQLSF